MLIPNAPREPRVNFQITKVDVYFINFNHNEDYPIENLLNQRLFYVDI